MKQVVTFGEILVRFEPPNYSRVRQAVPGNLHATFAGAEANVGVALSLLGDSSAFVTALPDNSLTDACERELRGCGVDTTHVLRQAEGRFGLFFLEKGAAQRPGSVLYDRSHSAISLVQPDDYPWEDIFKESDWLHISGITPALSEAAYESTLAAVKFAAGRELTISCDLNYRSKLWRWNPGISPEELAGECMSEILPYVDLLITNEHHLRDVFDIVITAEDPGVEMTNLERSVASAEQMVNRYPNLDQIAMTIRQSGSASETGYGAVLYDPENTAAHPAPLKDGEFEPYRITEIVDRVGAGDAFAAGLIFALRSEDYQTPGDVIAFAAASGCLAHSIPGDFNYVSRDEIDSLTGGSNSGWVQR